MSKLVAVLWRNSTSERLADAARCMELENRLNEINHFSPYNVIVG